MKSFPLSYRNIKKHEFTNDKFKITPIRYEDRYLIMNWRNEQLFHLRQKEPLSAKEQDLYFDTVVRNIFDDEKPNQYLFSFFEDEIMVAYGGLVHIDWKKKSAEISFLISNEKNKNFFSLYWDQFLKLIEEVAFESLSLHSIFTYSFELRPELYPILKENKFSFKKRLKNDISHGNTLVDSLIHIKWKEELQVRKAVEADKELIFNWVNDSKSRKHSINQREITWDEHCLWFDEKMKRTDTDIYIFSLNEPVGMIRLDKEENRFKISYNVSPNYRGNGYGDRIISWVTNQKKYKTLLADVKEDNIASHKIFLNNEFKLKKVFDVNGTPFTQYIR